MGSFVCTQRARTPQTHWMHGTNKRINKQNIYLRVPRIESATQQLSLTLSKQGRAFLSFVFLLFPCFIVSFSRVFFLFFFVLFCFSWCFHSTRPLCKPNRNGWRKSGAIFEALACNKCVSHTRQASADGTWSQAHPSNCYYVKCVTPLFARQYYYFQFHIFIFNLMKMTV